MLRETQKMLMIVLIKIPRVSKLLTSQHFTNENDESFALEPSFLFSYSFSFVTERSSTRNAA